MGDRTGFICLYRSMLDWEWHDDPNTLMVFIHLLLLANWTDTQWRGIPLKRGQLITSRNSLSKMTGLTECQVRTILKRLQMTGEITSASTNKYTVITLVKYGFYQDFDGKNDQQDPQQTANKNPNKQPTKQPQMNNREQKNNKTRERAAAQHTPAFSSPTVEDVAAYCSECGYQNDAQKFVDYYTARGWKMNVGLPMEDWRAAVRMWMNRDKAENRADKGEDVDWKFDAV